jgi:hypothetical protein
VNKIASVLRAGMDVYICASSSAALDNVSAAAQHLGRPLYWIPCSDSMHHTELLGEPTPDGDFNRTALFRAYSE